MKPYRTGRGGVVTALLRESPKKDGCEGNPGLKTPVSSAEFPFATKICPGSA